MNECVRHKFNGVFQDGGLPIFNTLVIHVIKDADTQANTLLYLRTKGSANISVTGDGYYSLRSNMSDHYTNEYTLTEADGRKGIYFYVGATYDIHITGKYDLTEVLAYSTAAFSMDIVSIDFCDLSVNLQVTGHVPYGNISNIKSFPNSAQIIIGNNSIENTGLFGSIKTLENVTACTNFNCVNTGISGDIAFLSKMTSLTTLDIAKSAVTGTVESFVEGQIDNQRSSVGTDSPIRVTGILSRVKFGGQNYSDANNLWLTWESASKIVIYSGTSVTNYTKVYAKGATEQEVSDWEQAGKTVVVIN